MESDWKERALSAERAVDVLKRKVIRLYDGSQTNFQRQLERARRREEDNRRRQEVMAARNEELRRIGERLEREVAARTHDLQIILDNVTFGFLVVGREGTIRPGYTRSCHTLLGASGLEGHALVDVLGTRGAARLQLQIGLDQVFEDLLPDDVVIEQLPQRFPIADGRTLRVEGRVLRAEGGVEGLLLTLTDMTALEAAQREAVENRLLVDLLRQREAFLQFVVDAHTRLAAGREAVAHDDLPTARRALHTVKGNAASFGLEEVVSTVHRVESEPVGSSSFDVVEAVLSGFLARHGSVLGIEYDHARSGKVEVAEDQLVELRGLAASFHDRERAVIRRWTADVLRKPAGVVLGPIGNFVERLAERLEKAVDVHLEGLDTMVDVEATRATFENLTHLIRNAVDHGIERPDERGEKPSRARLTLAISGDPSAYRIVVSDDGRGIDTTRLRARARDQGLALSDGMTEEEALELIFVEGLSTAERATEISGRGVGMSAVKVAVEESGGTILVRSQKGVGTTFEIIVPRQREAAVAA